MIIALWIVTGLAAAVFIFAGTGKAITPRAKLAGNMAWVEDFSDPQVKAIGILEVLGGIGLVLPVLTGIAPWLTVAAGLGLVITMIGAIVVHARRGERTLIIPNVVLGGLALFAAIGWMLQLTA